MHWSYRQVSSLWDSLRGPTRKGGRIRQHTVNLLGEERRGQEDCPRKTFARFIELRSFSC